MNLLGLLTVLLDDTPWPWKVAFLLVVVPLIWFLSHRGGDDDGTSAD